MAIALDTTTVNSSSNSWSHTCTGSNLILVVSFRSTITSTTCTYNSVSMTRLSQVAFNGTSAYLNTFYLLNPSTGANTVLCGGNISNNDGGVSISYTGVAGIDNSGNNVANATNSTFTATLTTSNNNSRVIVTCATGDTQTAGTGATQRGANTHGVGIYDNNANKTPAGSVSEQVNINSSTAYCYQIFSIQPDLGTRYWVGGTGTWDTTTTHWSQTSGGTAGVTAPTNQTVAIDGASGGGTVTLGANATAASLTTTGFTGTLAQSTFGLTVTGNILFSALTYSGSGALSVGGNLTLDAGMTLSYTGPITFTSTSSGKTFTTGTKTLGSNLVFNGASGGWTLQDALTTSGSLTITNGTLNSNALAVSTGAVSNAGTLTTSNSAISCTSFTNTGIATLGSSVITLTGTGTVWSGGGTVTAGTSTIKITDASSSSKTFAGAGLIYNNLWLTGAGTGTFIITGSNTFNDFKCDTPPHTINFTALTTQNLQTFTVNGTAGNLMTLQSTSAGTQWRLHKTTSGNVSCDYLSLQDSNVTSP